MHRIHSLLRRADVRGSADIIPYLTHYASFRARHSYWGQKTCPRNSQTVSTTFLYRESKNASPSDICLSRRDDIITSITRPTYLLHLRKLTIDDHAPLHVYFPQVHLYMTDNLAKLFTARHSNAPILLSACSSNRVRHMCTRFMRLSCVLPTRYLDIAAFFIMLAVYGF